MNSHSFAPYINYLKILGLRPIEGRGPGWKKWGKYSHGHIYCLETIIFLHTAYAFVSFNLNLLCNSLLTYFRPATIGRGQVGYKGGQKKICPTVVDCCTDPVPTYYAKNRTMA